MNRHYSINDLPQSVISEWMNIVVSVIFIGSKQIIFQILIFMMKTKIAYILPKTEEELYESNVAYPESPSKIVQKGEKRLKKDSLKEKIRLKNEKLLEEKAKNTKCELPNDKTKSDQDHSVTTQELELSKSKISPSISLNRSVFHLDKLISKPPYITVTQINKIMGDYGHGTAVFKRPFIEGSYFLEITVKQDCKKDKKIKFKSAVRVGIVKYDYNTSFPIGYNESLAYKSTDGSFVKDSEKIEHKDSYGVGDVIGMVVRISSPKKERNSVDLQEGSSLSFYKNGELVYQFNKLKQTFYCFAVGFYNYSQIEVNLNPKSIYPMCTEAKQYWAVLNQKIPYSDLQQLKIFKI